MSELSDISETIRRSATEGVKRAKGDNGEMEQHSLTEQIEADRYLCNKKAASRGPGGLRFTRIVPPGSA